MNEKKKIIKNKKRKTLPIFCNNNIGLKYSRSQLFGYHNSREATHIVYKHVSSSLAPDLNLLGYLLLHLVCKE